MPSIPGTMHSSIQLFLFGDLTVSFEEDLRQLLHVKESGALCSFFDQVSFALREDFGRLPASKQDWFPRFTTLIDLLSKLGETDGTPALKFALLCVCQIGKFIREFGDGPRPFPSAANSYLVGLCTGSFAAAAISVSHTLSDLIPAGIEAVLSAFRTGLRSLDLRNDIERPIPELSRSWSVIVSAHEAQAAESIEAFSLTNSLPGSSRPYVSAATPSSVTISGPPSVLKAFLAATSLTPHYLSIESPYHAPHLFGPSDVNEIIGGFHKEVVGSYKPRIPLLSAASGKIVVAGDFKTLLQRVVSDTLCEQVRWDNILRSCVEEVFQRTTFKSCSIYPVSSNAAQLLSSVLTGNSKIEVTIKNILNAGVLTSQPAKPTGRFEQSKIAIIGFSGRFPEAASNEDFWKLLRAGLDVHRTIPEDRFNWKTHFDPTGKKKNTSRVQYGCFIKEPGLFDARFFNMSPRESENTDPAQRLAITATYEALEMAGMVPNRTPSTQQDRIGVFFGVTSDDWREVNSGQNIDTYFIPGGNRAFVPGRISYFFRFCGPSLSIDTACSSSLAAIQTACSYLWRGDCDTAIAGGTNVLTNPDNFAGLDRGHFLSTTGNCNAFDDGASGYCRADAVGSVILKRLEDAQADNDPIFGVIAGAYTNHCGQTDSITRPHEGDQVSVFKRILRHANVDPLDIGYIEMHGTGTQAGDATEMNSVLSVFVPGCERMPRYPLYLGSAKANIGHAESASGVSSLIKVLMMMKNNEIPPHCGIKTKINHNYPLDLTERNVNIAFKPVAWNRTDSVNGKRTVFLNNFSAAGGNTAVLLEDAPVRRSETEGKDGRTAHLVTVTAKSTKSLRGNIESLINFLEVHPDIALSALSYTTTARRIQHSYRIICSGSDIKSIQDAFKTRLSSSDVKPVPSGTKLPNVAFVFTGQGSLYIGIGQQLFESVSHFRADILRFDGIAQRQGFPSFLPLVDGSVTNVEEVEPVVAHLALTCVQMAISRLWVSWGVRPSSTIGHSLGEYAALHAAGVLTASNVIHVVGTRAQLLSKCCRKGSHAMLAVKASLEAIKPHLSGSSCEIACINQPTGNVISGPSEDVNRLTNEYRSLGYECVRLDIPFAFHSAQVDPIMEAFEAATNGVRFSIPSIPYMSPLLGRVVSDGGTVRASYLTRALRNAVNFQGALEAAKASSIVDERTIWLEIGSHPACSGMIKGTLGSHTVTIPSLRKDADTWKVLARGLELLYLNGIEIQWSEYHRDFASLQTVLELPRYSWDLKQYWIQYKNDFCLTKGDSSAPRQAVTAPLEQTPPPVYISPSVQRVLEEHHEANVSTLVVESDVHDPRLAPIFQGHKVNGAALCPSSLYGDIAITIVNYMLKANNLQSDTTGLDVGDARVGKPLIAVSNSGPQLLRVSASADWATKVVTLAFYSVNAHGGKTADHATCQVRITANQTWLQDWKRSSYLIKSRITSLHEDVDGGDSHKMKRGLIYKLFSSIVDYESRYQGMQEVVLNSNELEATAQVSFQVEDEGFYFNPCWIDSLGHIAGFIMNGNDNVYSKNQVFINEGWDTMRCATKFTKGKTYQSYNKMQLASGTLYIGDTYILDEGRVIAVIEGVRFKGIPRQVLDHVLPSKSGVAKGAVKSPNTAATNAHPPTQSKPAPAAKVARHPEMPAPPSNANPVKSIWRDSIVTRVMAIISDAAGLDSAELGQNSEFAEFGIDSLLSLTITGRLQEELGLSLPSTLFGDYPTVRELISFLNGSQAPPPASIGASDDREVSTSEQDTASEATSISGLTDATSITETDNVLEVIRATIAEETGVALEELTHSTNFSELGMDSLLVLTVLGKLGEVLDMDLPQGLLLENDNLNDVGKALDLKPKGARGNKASVAVAAEVTQLEAGTPHATSILLQGNAKSAKKTLFLFPDGSGSATSYASLPKVSPDIVVYGLNCPWMKTPQDMKCSLEQLTAKYIVEIRRRQPKGPYYFGGWSAGGICAYEAAQQLARSGEKTARLILIDSPNPIGLENPPQRMYDFFESLDFFGMNGKAPPSWLRPHFDAFISMLDYYKVSSFAGPPLETHLVYARDGICKHPGDPRPEIRPDDPREMLWLLNNRTDFSGFGWRELVGTENLNIHVLDDVNHFSMVAPGQKIQELSDFIKRAMA
ncbi:MAG: Type I Iterative PKS [Peltula sp. TS41687]|nr:MAG: Type I Iterative PKS [Peltula sp. TS41687]